MDELTWMDLYNLSSDARAIAAQTGTDLFEAAGAAWQRRHGADIPCTRTLGLHIRRNCRRCRASHDSFLAFLDFQTTGWNATDDFGHLTEDGWTQISPDCEGVEYGLDGDVIRICDCEHGAPDCAFTVANGAY